MVGRDASGPLATTHEHVVWENMQLRLECNLVRHRDTAQDAFAVRIRPAVEPYYTSVVIPAGADGQLHLVGRYRYAIDRWSIEFPRFELDSSEAGWRDAAQADLQRATSLSARQMNILGAIQIDPSLLSTTAVVILAQGCDRRRPRSKKNADAGSERTVDGSQELIAGSVSLPLAELAELVEQGQIVCGVTLAALALYRAWLL